MVVAAVCDHPELIFPALQGLYRDFSSFSGSNLMMNTLYPPEMSHKNDGHAPKRATK